MRNKLSVLALLVAVLALLAVTFAVPKNQKPEVVGSVYARVMEARTLRCAYQVWPPFLAKDPNSGQLSGVYYDLLQKIGEGLSLKIDWVEEVGSANYFEGFRTGRYDAGCSAITPSPERALVSDFSIPIGYAPFYLYAREGDHRFDDNYQKANADDVTIMTSDGTFADSIANEVFPKAKTVSLPNLTNGADMLEGVAAGKADVTIMDVTLASDFAKNNPGKIRRVVGPPVRFPSLSIALPPGEEKLRRMIDITLVHLMDTGFLDKILSAHGLDDERVLRPALPYQRPNSRETTEGGQP